MHSEVKTPEQGKVFRVDEMQTESITKLGEEFKKAYEEGEFTQFEVVEAHTQDLFRNRQLL